MSLTLDQYYMGRDRDARFAPQLTDQLRKDAAITVAKASELLSRFGQDRKINSGWRPAEINAATPGAAKSSNHMYCRAVDLSDPEGTLADWCIRNIEVLIEIGLWLESPGATKGWVHVQIVPPKSGHRIFLP